MIFNDGVSIVDKRSRYFWWRLYHAYCFSVIKVGKKKKKKRKHVKVLNYVFV